MSVQSVALAEGGVVVGYNGTETSGTTLADFGPNNLPATLGARGALNGTPIVTGMARAITASSGTGAVATRAVASGSPLQLQNEITVCGFVSPGSATPPATGGLLGERAANWQFRRNSLRLPVVYVTVDGVLQSTRPLNGTTALAAGERAFVWFRKHADGWFDIGVNDGVEDRAYLPGVFNNITDTLNIGSVSNNSFEGTMFPFIIFDHAVDLGVFRALMREDPTLDYGAVNGVGSVLFDFAGDTNSRVAETSPDAYCAGPYCGARMRAGETRVTASNGKVYHLGCRTSNARGTGAMPVTSSTTQADIAKLLDRHIRFFINAWSHRTGTSKPAYWDGAKWRSQTNPNGTNFHNECGMGTMAAALARFLKTGPGDPLMKVAYQNVELGMTGLVTGVGGNDAWWSNNDFSLPHVGKMLVFLNGRMDKTQWQTWVDRFLFGVDIGLVDGGLNTTTSVQREPGGGAYAPWYINGNRELGILEALWCAWYLDPTSTRRTNYETQRAWVASPSAGSWQPGGSASGLLFGLVTQVAPSQADGSDGKAWFRESHGGVKGFWNNGGQVEGDSEKETINVDGFTKEYTATQMERSTNLFLLSGEQIYARWSNMLLNKDMDFLDTTTGSVEGSYGSRHPADFTWQQATPLVNTWRGQRAVPLDATVMANMFTIFLRQLVANGRSPNDATGRDVAGSNATAFLMGLDAWPGH